MQLAQPLRHQGATRQPPPLTPPYPSNTSTPPPTLPSSWSPTTALLHSVYRPCIHSERTHEPVAPESDRAPTPTTHGDHQSFAIPQANRPSRHLSLSRTHIQRTGALPPTRYFQCSAVVLKRETIANRSICFQRMQWVVIQDRAFPIARKRTTRCSPQARVLVQIPIEF